MPERYQWNGITVLYPENWEIQEDDDSLNIESPTGAFVVLSRPENIDEALDRARKTMEQEYDEVETESLSRVVGESLLEGITQRFVYLDLIITSHLFKLETEDQDFVPLLIQIQGEDRDLDRLQQVFDAILASVDRLS
jgi:hypothetical protein